MQTKKRFFPLEIILLLGLAISLTACTASNTPDADIPAEQTEPPPTLTPLPTFTPTATLAMIPTTVPIQSTPPPMANTIIIGTQEAEDQTPDFGVSVINILQPGQFSRLVSPIRILSNLQTGEDRRVQITLYGEDGRIVAEKNFTARPYDDPKNGNLITELAFEIEALAEAGRLELKVLDRYERIKALNSVNLVLLSDGANDRNYAPESAERIELQLPFPGQTEIETSPLLVSGLVRTQSNNPVDIWLVDESGATLGLAQAAVVHTSGSQIGQFIGEVSYSISEPTRVLMTLAISDSRIPGYTYIKSVDLVLNP